MYANVGIENLQGFCFNWLETIVHLSIRGVKYLYTFLGTQICETLRGSGICRASDLPYTNEEIAETTLRLPVASKESG